MKRFYHSNVPHILCEFLWSPPDAQRKEKQGTGKEKGRERGIWDCCILLSGEHRPPPPPPPPLPYLARPTSPARGHGYQGLEVLWGAPPPPHHPHPFSTVWGHSIGSRGQPLIWGWWVWKLILDSDSKYLYFFSFLIGRLWAEIGTAIVWQKSVNFRRTPILCWRPKFVTFSAWRAGRISRYNAGESPPIKEGWPEAMPHLATACKGINTIWETKEIFYANIFLTQDFCQRETFVGARFLSTWDFCRLESFVSAKFLLTREFCTLHYWLH